MGGVRWDSTERKGQIKKRAGKRRGRKRGGGRETVRSEGEERGSVKRRGARSDRLSECG